MNPTPKTFYVENLGCAKNQVDAETMIAALQAQGLERLTAPDRADLIIVNTCGFLASARAESIQVLLELSEACPDASVVPAGCMAERDGEELLRSMPEVAAVFGNRAPEEIGRVVRRLGEGERFLYRPEYRSDGTGSVDSSACRPRTTLLSFPGSGYVKISEGCNHRCAYCAIPLIRGGLRSRSPDEIVDEVRFLLQSGVFEINLIAQDLAAFGEDAPGRAEGRAVGGSALTELLRRICGLPGSFWIRLLYIHPDNFPPGLLDLVASDPRLLPYFDLPFQHASARILRSMGRTGTEATYLDLVAKIRDRLPDAVIRSTFLVGFPGERRADFETLLHFQRRAALDWVGFFRYCREEGTPAFRMRGAIGHRLSGRGAERRKHRLEQLQRPISEERMQRFSGRRLDVLIEERIRGEELALGRAYLQAPEVDGNVVVHSASAAPGEVLRCRIVGVNGIDLEGIPE